MYQGIKPRVYRQLSFNKEVKEKAEIYCPHCSWRPKSEDRWECMPSCATVWNTFWTRGVCPGCSCKWEKTQCFGCGELSPHEAWYHYPPESESEERHSEQDHHNVA